MYPDRLKELILEGESSTIEFKRKFTTPEKIAKEITAFANTLGGYIFFGIDDDGSVVGVESEKGEIEFIEIACNFYVEPPIEPEIDIVELEGKDIVVVYIPESKTKPHKMLPEPDNRKTHKTAFIRIGEQSVIASKEMTRVLAGLNVDSPPVKLIIGEKEKRLFAYLEVHKRATVLEFANLTNISRRRAERLMVRLVRAGVLQIHQDTSSDYFTLVGS
jgi:predicted HTH transcriptional regulator